MPTNLCEPATLKLLILGFRVRAFEGRHPAFGSPDLSKQVRRILRTYDHWRAGARPPSVDQTAHAPPDVPVRELGRIRPPVRNLSVGSPERLRLLLFLHRDLPASPTTLAKSRTDQYRAEQLYHVINSDLC